MADYSTSRKSSRADKTLSLLEFGHSNQQARTAAAVTSSCLYEDVTLRLFIAEPRNVVVGFSFMESHFCCEARGGDGINYPMLLINMRNLSGPRR